MRRGGLVLLALLACAGCSGAVQITPPDPTERGAAVCAAMAADLPSELAKIGERRESTPASDFTAAWGDPPVSWRCGVPTPAALHAESLLVTVEGVDWLPEELTGGYLLTSVGRAVNVELTVPTAQGPAPSVAADLAAVIIKDNPVT